MRNNDAVFGDLTVWTDVLMEIAFVILSFMFFINVVLFVIYIRKNKKENERYFSSKNKPKTRIKWWQYIAVMTFGFLCFVFIVKRKKF